MELVVARFVLKSLEAELPDAKITLLGEVRQLEDRLGLNPLALKKLQWRISPVQAVPAQPERSAADRRARFGVIKTDEDRERDARSRAKFAERAKNNVK